MFRTPLALLGALVLLGCAPDEEDLALPEPKTTGRMSIERALAKRRSLRTFAATMPTPEEIGQLLWAAQGVTGPPGRRTAPSAGALYPLELYVASSQGVARYLPGTHRLVRVGTTDVRGALYAASLRQDAVQGAPVVFVITADYARTRHKYGPRTQRYVHMESGHAAQNLLLQATALGLGGVTIGAFDDAALKRAIGCRANEDPLYVIPIGHPD